MSIKVAESGEKRVSVKIRKRSTQTSTSLAQVVEGEAGPSLSQSIREEDGTFGPRCTSPIPLQPNPCIGFCPEEEDAEGSPSVVRLNATSCAFNQGQ